MTPRIPENISTWLVDWRLLCWRDSHPQEWQLASLHVLLSSPHLTDG
jgi:hypothetical protein